MPDNDNDNDNTDLPPTYSPVEPEVTAASGLCPPGDVQGEIVGENQRAGLEAGDSWYLVSRAWYRKWEVATSGQANKEESLISIDEVGPIDTFSLLDQTGNLRPGLADGVDVIALSGQSWGMLKDW